MTFYRLCVLFLISLVACSIGRLAAGNDNWPQWRGPNANGISDSTNLPTTWNAQTGENVVWKTELPSWSGSTPIIWGDYIFINSPSKSDGNAPQAKGGRPKRDPGGQTLLLICLSKKDGTVRWTRELDYFNDTYNKQNSSSPSPVTDGKLVWVVTGNGVVTALDFDGKVIWKKKMQEEYGRFGLNWGYGSSPLLFDNKVIVEVLHGDKTDDPSYLVAFDATTGKALWREERPTDAPKESPDAYTTPALIRVGGKPQIVVSGGDYVTGHDPANGKELWRAAGLNPNKSPNFRIVNSPVVSDGMIYAGTRQKPLLALKAGGEGDVSTSHLAWKWDQDGGPDVPTPVSDGKYFYMVADNGLVTIIDAKTGDKIYQKRVNVGATVDSSPLLADGKLYVTGENAATVVLKGFPEFQEVARNELDGTFTLSSIAVSGRQLFLRTSTHLYCIGNKAAN